MIEVIEIKITGMSLSQINQVKKNLDSMGLDYKIKELIN